MVNFVIRSTPKRADLRRYFCIFVRRHERPPRGSQSARLTSTTPPRLLSAAEGAKKPSSRECGSLFNVPKEAPDDAKDPLKDYKYLIGKKVKMSIPYLGEVISAKIDKNHEKRILYHLYYPEDGDEEDLDVEEISQLECQKEPSLNCGMVGGCYLKDFEFEGIVTDVVQGESSIFVFPWM